MAYEFNEEQNLTIKKLYNQMAFVGIFILILGGLFVVHGLKILFGGEVDPETGKKDPQFIFDLVVALVFIVMGVLTVMSANSFKRVVKTEGDDIEHLMEAIHKLTTWFSVQVMMIIIGIAIIVISIIM